MWYFASLECVTGYVMLSHWCFNYCKLCIFSNLSSNVDPGVIWLDCLERRENSVKFFNDHIKSSVENLWLGSEILDMSPLKIVNISHLPEVVYSFWVSVTRGTWNPRISKFSKTLTSLDSFESYRWVLSDSTNWSRKILAYWKLKNPVLRNFCPTLATETQS
jgi:hypothetical protein